jgi:hypothetical protein
MVGCSSGPYSSSTYASRTPGRRRTLFSVEWKKVEKTVLKEHNTGHQRTLRLFRRSIASSATATSIIPIATYVILPIRPAAIAYAVSSAASIPRRICDDLFDSSYTNPSHNSQRRRASGRTICCPCTKVISWRWQSETYPRTWTSFWKHCHSPLALRQNSLSVSPSGVPSIGSEYTQPSRDAWYGAGAGRVAGAQRNAVLPWSRYMTSPGRLQEH